MTQNCTMKLAKHLNSIALLVILLCAQQQSVEAKNVNGQAYETYGATYESQLYDTNALVKKVQDLRDIKELWSKIKEGAITTWNYVKSVAEKTKEKINIFVENVKEHANDLKHKFEMKLKELNDRVNYIVSDIYGTGELVKICLKKEQQNMEGILKEIMAKMGECIAEEINKLTLLNRDDSLLSMNETMFIKDMDDKVRLCESDTLNLQECLCKVRENIFNNFTDMENRILKIHFDSRNIVDDVKATLVTCSLNNLIDATNLISTEMVQIAKCVLEAKEDGKEEESGNEI